ncbi:hypothetical protein N9F11_00360 [Akkermansiaceae bacterium]|nr:hypothetical protein [Akkermansiaceae bacterium]
MIELFYITNDCLEAKIVDKLDINWLFLDLEIVGKKERQIGRSTVLSDHSIDDVRKLRKIIRNTGILVRCNPIGVHSEKEFEEINNTPGIDMVMLPFFHTVEEVRMFIQFLDTSRIKPALLIETVGAVENLREILALYPFEYVHIGLNDIHIERKTSFMFEPYVDGFLAGIVAILAISDQKFGVGGIGKIGSDLLPTPECVINEHTRLGSSGVIISRSFKGNFSKDSKDSFEKELKKSVEKFRNQEKISKELDYNQLLVSYDQMKADTNKVVENINENK